MKDLIQKYLQSIEDTLRSGDAREHAYRPAFQKLIEDITTNITVINEPAYTGGNAPDFLFKKGDTPIAYAECKDITVDIENFDVQKQAMRYVDAFGKILLTNYVDFQIINEDGIVEKISIGEINNSKIVHINKNFEHFESLLKDYITPTYRTVNSAKKLAEIMAIKARLLRDNALASLSENENSDISNQYQTFKEVLIKDLTHEDFADMYAQTLVYGLFVARYFDPTLEDFSRHEAHDRLPATNPLLKKFFGHVAGVNYDPKIAWMVDSLIETYLAADVRGLMHKEFTKKQKDPVLHFYETFLSEYDQKLRKSRGVYYTPEPVVSFIVRSIDNILKNKFNVKEGLADTTLIEHDFKTQGEDRRRKDDSKTITEKIHKVQILDPAVGTGTFLNEVIHEIYKSFEGQEGLWEQYTKDHLLPRLHGFELMMASYTMAHLKLGVTLKELGYGGNERLSVWLTNSLEESVHEVPSLFMSQWLTEESNQASKIKSEMPIMIVTGNPPYSVSSSNKGEHIQSLISDYKKNLNERKINLDDDYIKFIRYAENQIEKTGYGIVAMITNNSFIDGVTHRQMRKHLMETFDEIYILDLHGNSKKKEVSPDGSKDENVFDIQQGVSINLFIKNNTKKESELAHVFHDELHGTRKSKYEFLEKSSFMNRNWNKLDAVEPNHYFVPKDFRMEEEYNKGFKINNLLEIYSSGIETAKDSTVIKFTSEDVQKVVDDFNTKENKELVNLYNINENKVSQVTSDLKRGEYGITEILYRPFDIRNTVYTDKSQGVLWRPKNKIMRHAAKENYSLLLTKRVTSFPNYHHVFITDLISERCTVSLQTGEVGNVFPLYLYENDEKIPNLNKEIWEEINNITGETKPEDILDYIYAVLHSESYREKYKEFLKIDFPCIPYPKNKDLFWKLVELGTKLREVHLLESVSKSDFQTTFSQSGTNIVEKKHPKYEDGNIHINEIQYFGNVSEVVWNFYIGGYQPAQKWLKDRKEIELSIDDIQHYQKIIVALTETDKTMKEINKLNIL